MSPGLKEPTLLLSAKRRSRFRFRVEAKPQSMNQRCRCPLSSRRRRGIGAGGDLLATPRGRDSLERDRVHRLRDLVDDQVGELCALFAVQSL
jgi:hypothetical protein